MREGESIDRERDERSVLLGTERREAWIESEQSSRRYCKVWT